MVQAQLRLIDQYQARGHGKNYVERLFNSASNDNNVPLDVWLKRMLPISVVVGGILLLLF